MILFSVGIISVALVTLYQRYDYDSNLVFLVRYLLEFELKMICVVNEEMVSKEESLQKVGLEGALRDHLSTPLAPRDGIST